MLGDGTQRASSQVTSARVTQTVGNDRSVPGGKALGRGLGRSGSRWRGQEPGRAGAGLGQRDTAREPG